MWGGEWSGLISGCWGKAHSVPKVTLPPLPEYLSLLKQETKALNEYLDTELEIHLPLEEQDNVFIHTEV